MRFSLENRGIDKENLCCWEKHKKIKLGCDSLQVQKPKKYKEKIKKMQSFLEIVMKMTEFIRKKQFRDKL